MINTAAPSPFILEQIDSWLAERPENAAKQPVQLVDFACGSGRHIRAILGRECEDKLQITAVDIDSQSLETLISSADSTKQITPICLDLEREDLDLGAAFRDKLFDIVLVTNYLHRPLLGQIFGRVSPGGRLLYGPLVTAMQILADRQILSFCCRKTSCPLPCPGALKLFISFLVSGRIYILICRRRSSASLLRKSRGKVSITYFQ